MSANREMVAWAAGLFEGEGCISIRRDRYVTLLVTMVDEDVLRRFAHTVGVGNVVELQKGKTNVQTPYRWTVSSAGDAQHVLKMLLPFLCSRRRAKALRALELVDGMLSQLGARECLHCGATFTPATLRIASRKRYCGSACWGEALASRRRLSVAA